MKILFIGDIFDSESINWLEQNLKRIKKNKHIDLVIAQCENASQRRGLVISDYQRLKKAGIDIITMGNHIWTQPEILKIIDSKDIVRPYNVDKKYPGCGSRVFKKNGKTIRVTELLGISFLNLGRTWNSQKALNFFDAVDEILQMPKTDYHLIDFHAETTSEKNVLALYVDGKVSAFVGTHTHVQTNDARILPKGTAFITDVGMVGPINSAIGADYKSVYEKMRFDKKVKFGTSKNPIQFNAVVITLGKKKNKIKPINIL